MNEYDFSRFFFEDLTSDDYGCAYAYKFSIPKAGSDQWLVFYLWSIEWTGDFIKNSPEFKLCSEGSTPSTEFIFLDNTLKSSMENGKGISQRYYIYESGIKGRLQMYRQILDKYFEYFVENAPVFKKELELCLGIYDEFTYAHIMTHIKPEYYFSLRLFDWKHISQMGLGKKNGENGVFETTQENILTKLGISELCDHSLTNYIIVPLSTCVDFGSEHISTLIISKPPFDFSKKYIFSFDTMGGVKVVGSHAQVGAFGSRLTVNILNDERIQGISGCALYTAFVIEGFFNEVEKHLDKLFTEKDNNGEVKLENENAVRVEIIKLIRKNFINLFEDMPKGKEVKVSEENGSIIVKGKVHGRRMITKCENDRLGGGNMDIDNHNDISEPKVDEAQEEESEQEEEKSFQGGIRQKNEEKRVEWVEGIKEQQQKESSQSLPSFG